MAECKVNETAACCCVDVGTIIDNSDRLVEIQQMYSSENEAQEALAFFTSKARAAESEPCQISSEISATEAGYELKARFEFAYQVETMIFQLAIR